MLLTDATPLPIDPTLVMPIVIGLVSVVAIVVVVAMIFARRRRDRMEIDELAARYRFEPVDDAFEREGVRQMVDSLFGVGPKVGRMLKQRSRGLDFHLVTMRVPLYRVDERGEWDERLQESQEKLVLFVSGFDSALPAFRLMPNSWALSTVRGKEANLMHDIEPFGYRNYVIGEDKERIIRLLSGEPMHLLRRNTQLTIDSREGFLAFYLQDERPLPPNLPAFVDLALALSIAVRERLEAGAPRAA